jgi:hypothetical protein
MVGVAQARLVLAMAQQAGAGRRGAQGLAHAHGPEPVGVGADDFVDGEQDRPGGEGRRGAPEPRWKRLTELGFFRRRGRNGRALAARRGGRKESETERIHAGKHSRRRRFVIINAPKPPRLSSLFYVR